MNSHVRTLWMFVLRQLLNLRRTTFNFIASPRTSL
jgi:hypothetical protein